MSALNCLCLDHAIGQCHSSVISIVDAAKDNPFVFDWRLCDQIDGVAMGSPMGPSIAKLFMYALEKKFLDDYPPQFKPIMYRRYVDNTFCLFKNEDHVDPFLDHIVVVEAEKQDSVLYELYFNKQKNSILSIALISCPLLLPSLLITSLDSSSVPKLKNYTVLPQLRMSK